jgi:hypothetical protein
VPILGLLACHVGTEVISSLKFIMSRPPEIVCLPTKWFLTRIILMLAMFGGFAVYFLYDWKVGYPQKNYIIAHYKAFVAAGQAQTDPEKWKDWEAFVKAQKIPFEDDHSIYPAETDFEEKWPAILADKEAMKKESDEGLWKIYSGEKGWPQTIDVQEDRKPAYKIKEQLVAATVCFGLAAVAIFFLIRTKGRNMRVDEEAYYAPGGAKILFPKITEIDMRKWNTKGLATLTYKDSNGENQKAKVDGMVYGQFKEEDGAPAEALFQKILANFDGELIELVVEDDDDLESENEQSAESGENNG